MAEATPDGIADGYASELRREILRSEIQRVQVLAVVLAILLVTTVTATTCLPGLLERIFRGRLAWWEPLASIGPFALYEFIVLFVLSRRASRDGDFPRYARFANAFIETSLPSVMILDAEPAHGADGALRLLAAAALFHVHPAVDLAARLLAVAVDRRPSRRCSSSCWSSGSSRWSPIPPRPSTRCSTISPAALCCCGAGVIAGIVARSLRRQFDKSVAAAAARDRITNMFGQHVSPAVVDRLLASRTDPPSEMREVCVLFLDIRGFTAMTRVRPADETVALLNDFFAEMIDVVDRNHGIINKFLGDGFLALFGAPLEDPKAAVNALAAARGMLEAVDRWNKARPQTTLRVGIGIHLGEAVTGTVGSPQRKEYTVIGDTVNLAARLEQLTKETGSQLLVSSSVHRATTGADGATDLGPLPIRGYDEECGYGRWCELVLRLRLQHERARLFEERLKPEGVPRASGSRAGSTAGGSPSTSGQPRRGPATSCWRGGGARHVEPAAGKGFEVLDRYEAWPAATTSAIVPVCAATPAPRSRRSPMSRC